MFGVSLGVAHVLPASEVERRGPRGGKICEGQAVEAGLDLAAGCA